MSKTNYLKLAILPLIAGLQLTSCSKNDVVEPTAQPIAITSSNEVGDLAAASTKISVVGSTLQLGINGHPFGDAPYIATPAATQMQLLKGMGMSWYRINVDPSSDGSMPVPTLSKALFAAAEAGKINLLPMLYPRTLDYNKTPAQSYTAGKLFGSKFAVKNGKYFSYYDLGNDLDLKVLLPGKTGTSQSHYDIPKFNVIAAYIKGMDEGIKENDPGAKTMVSAGWIHYGFIRMLDWYGVKFDVVAYHWYSEMEAIAPKSPTNIPDITLKLAELFPTKPIWITETNTRYKSTSKTNDADQNTFLTNFIAKCKKNPQVKVVILYELFNEPYKSTLESNYGILKWKIPYISWVKSTVANNLTIN